MSLGADRTSTTNPSERDAHPFTAAFYVAAANTAVDGSPISDAVSIYRLYTGSDHFDSRIAGEGGATTEGIIGYSFSDPNRPATVPLFREYDTTPGSANFGDHAVLPHGFSDTDRLYPDYHADSFIGSAYPRVPGSDQVFEWLAASGTIVRSNLAVGCAVWEWWWNGVQYINDFDYGRQMQSALYYGPSALNEAGDGIGPAGGVTNPDLKHPSPCASHLVMGPVEVTSAVPLDFNPQSVGGDGNHPVIYPQTKIGKVLTLDWNPDGTDRRWNVSQYRTTVSVPNAITAVVEAPSAYLNAQFTSYGSYDFTTGTFTLIPRSDVIACTPGSATPTAHCPQSNGYNVNGSGAGPQALIFTDGQNHAMGVYINAVNAGFVITDQGTGSSPGQYGSNFVKWGVNYNGGLVAATSSHPSLLFDTFIVTDTLPQVEAALSQLYVWRSSVNSQHTLQ